jgi:PAS domain S-box-containing protein
MLNQDLHILMMEDEPADAELIRRFLEKSGFHFTTTLASDKESFILALDQIHFDIILADNSLPQFNATDALYLARKKNSCTPFILVTGTVSEEYAAEIIKHGADDYILKGNLQRLPTAILKAMENNQVKLAKLKTEELLRESEQNYRSIFERASDAIVISDREGQILEANSKACSMMGLSLPELQKINIKDVFYNESHIDTQGNIDQLLNGKTLITERKIKSTDGRIYDLEISSKMLPDGRLQAFSRDITERKKAAEALQKSNERFKIISKTTNDVLFEWNIQNNEIWFSDSYFTLFGFDPDKPLPSLDAWLEKIHPHDRQSILDRTEQLKNNLVKIWQDEIRFLQADNTYGTVLQRGFVLNSIDGKTTRVLGSFINITERKKAEIKLSESEKYNRNLFTQSPVGLVLSKLDGSLVDVNEAFAHIIGYSIEECKHLNVIKLTTEKFQSLEMKILKELEHKKNFNAFEKEYLHKNGHTVPVNITGTTFERDGERYIWASVEDITERKAAEAELKKLSLVAKETINGVVITDKDQRILWINDAFTKMTGYSLDESVGKKPGEFLQGPLTDPGTIQFIKEEIQKKRSFSFEILNYHKTGRTFIVHIQIQPLFNEEGELIKFFAIQTDISLQKELEEKLMLEDIIKQKEITEAVIAAQENERTEIGRELHDNVNQLLGAIQLYINMAKSNDNERDSLLNSSLTFTQTAIEEIRKLSKSLITPLTTDIGLKEIINGLTTDLQKVHPIHFICDIHEFEEDKFNEKFKLNLFRIVQEQINNIIKHAKSSHVVISLRSNTQDVFLSITDDGIGFDKSKPSKGVGISNIKSRAEIYKGNVHFNSTPGTGCTLLVNFDKIDLLLV